MVSLFDRVKNAFSKVAKTISESPLGKALRTVGEKLGIIKPKPTFKVTPEVKPLKVIIPKQKPEIEVKPPPPPSPKPTPKPPKPPEVTRLKTEFKPQVKPEVKPPTVLSKRIVFAICHEREESKYPQQGDLKTFRIRNYYITKEIAESSEELERIKAILEDEGCFKIKDYPIKNPQDQNEILALYRRYVSEVGMT